MAPNLDTLPMEILLRIAEMSTWGVSPSSDEAHPATYARNHASLARTCRWLYEALNGELYKRNLEKDPVTESCLLWAVNAGNLDTIKRAVTHGANLHVQIEVHDETEYCLPWGWLDRIDSINRNSPPSFSLLHLAVGRRHGKVVEYLLEEGVDVHAPSLDFCCRASRYEGASIYPIHLCVSHDDCIEFDYEWLSLQEGSPCSDSSSTYDLAELLVANGAYLLAEDNSAIHDLFAKGHHGLVTKLLAYSDPVSLWEGLHFAASQDDFLLAAEFIQRDLSTVKLLLRQPEVNPTVHNQDGYTPLLSACHNGNPELVQLMLEQPGVSTRRTNILGQTSIHAACYSDHPEISDTIKLLIDWKAPMDQVSNDGTPLLIALERKKFDIASMLVAEGCDPASWAPRWNRQPSHIFDRLPTMPPASQTEFVHRLVEVGIELDIRCYFDCLKLEATPMFIAACTLNASCMRELFQGGARLNSVVIGEQPGSQFGTRTFLTALLHLLFSKSHQHSTFTEILDGAEEIIVFALENGATLERAPRPDSNYRSALEYAVAQAEIGDTELLELLLKHSTARNISRGFIRRVIRGCMDDSVREMLLDFEARELSYNSL
ncbi:unnamed protein product [Clonostachys rosea]|uniref:F-box domain-containing protein n=1 Tax=Bionectria ochroleuca TaxID=29856 RepID=A0ABY6UWM0_BIOOC|nr:unnamed protein product [Clonostachys rosea]